MLYEEEKYRQHLEDVKSIVEKGIKMYCDEFDVELTSNERILLYNELEKNLDSSDLQEFEIEDLEFYSQKIGLR